MKVRETHLSMVLPSLVTWRVAFSASFRTCPRWAGQETQSAWRCQLEKLRMSWFNPPNCGFLSWFDICTLAIYPTTDHTMNKTPVISNSVFLFQKEMRFVSPRICGNWSQWSTSWLVRVPNMHSTCASSARWNAVHDADVNDTVPSSPSLPSTWGAKPVMCPFSFCLQWHHLWEPLTIPEQERRCSVNLYFSYFWYPVTRSIFLKQH